MLAYEIHRDTKAISATRIWNIPVDTSNKLKINRMSKRCELQKEYYQSYGNYKGNGKYSNDYVLWLENKILELHKNYEVKNVKVAEW